MGNVRLNAYAIQLAKQTASEITTADISICTKRLFRRDQPADRIWGAAPRTELDRTPRHARTPAMADYVPPPHTSVKPLMNDLCKYVSQPSLTSFIVKAALSHLQFETIHPFTDGNGRVGRSLMHFILQRDIHTHGSAVVPFLCCSCAGN